MCQCQQAARGSQLRSSTKARTYIVDVCIDNQLIKLMLRSADLDCYSLCDVWPSEEDQQTNNEDESVTVGWLH